MDASRKIPGSIHDEKRIIQFYRRCPDNWVHIIRGGTGALYQKGAKIANAVFREIYRPCCEAVHAITNKEAFL